MTDPVTQNDSLPPNCLRLKRLGIETRQEFVIYMRADCPVCRAEGFTVHARVRVAANGNSIIASVHHVLDSLLGPDQASLSESAWLALAAQDGHAVTISHPRPLESLAYVRAKLYGRTLTPSQLTEIISDMVAGRYSDIELAAFVSGCAGQRLDPSEVLGLTRAMIEAGDRLDWDKPMIVDKHCVGGLPGNRTTPIVVPIVAANGLTIPKTSSRAITSPAGTADTMETMAPVDLDLGAMRRVVEQTGGCIVWGGAVHLSPADDMLIRVERALDIDSEGQLVASVLSKKVAAGSTHMVIDMPVGASAKVRSAEDAVRLTASLETVSAAFGLHTRVVVTDGRQPVGRGIGPALEAFDVLAVLRNEASAPADLRARAVELAGAVLELGGVTAPGGGCARATDTLDNGDAWAKFTQICEAQGGLREPPRSTHRLPVLALHAGRIGAIDNRKFAKVAKLAGAPAAPAAGADLHVRLGEEVTRGDPLFTIHAESPGELDYAAQYAAAHGDILVVFDE